MESQVNSSPKVVKILLKAEWRRWNPNALMTSGNHVPTIKADTKSHETHRRIGNALKFVIECFGTMKTKLTRNAGFEK